MILTPFKLFEESDTNARNVSIFFTTGQFHRANGWVMNDCLSYIKPNVEDAIDTCKRLNPHFHIEYIEVEP